LEKISDIIPGCQQALTVGIHLNWSFDQTKQTRQGSPIPPISVLCQAAVANPSRHV
jgi:hypothetical protein